MQYGVLDAAGVLVYREPLLSPLRVERSLIVVGREVTVPVPRGVHEGVHRVRLARGRAAAAGALRVVELRVELEGRFARRHELGFLGEQNRQVLLGNGDRAALIAEDYGDRGPPVALAADQPVVQPVRDRGLAGAALLELLAVPIRRRNHGPDLDPVFPRELEVPLVVGRYGHDRTRTVAHQDVVGDVDGDLLPISRVYGVGAGKDAGLLPRYVGAVDLAHPGGPLDVGAHLFGSLLRRYLLDRRVLRAHHEERGAEERVRAGGKDLDGAVVFDLEPDPGALGAPDPVPLQRLDPLGPVYMGEVQELLGVVRDLEEPLRQV